MSPLTIRRPMKVSAFDSEKLGYPALASIKYDGVRVIILDNAIKSKSMHDLPNKHIRKTLLDLQSRGLLNVDAEIIVGNPTDSKCLQVTMSATMAEDWVGDFSIYCFDYLDTTKPYSERLSVLKDIVSGLNSDVVKICEQVVVNNADELHAFEKNCLKLNYEGVVVRTLTGTYVQGESTPKTGGVMKILRHVSSEGVIIGFNQLTKNTNESFRNELGLLEKSTAKNGKVLVEALGSFVLQDIQSGKVFKLGLGLNMKQRTEYWEIKDSLMGKLVKFTYTRETSNGIPKLAVFNCLRDDKDMG